jgi:hypothetical protein
MNNEHAARPQTVDNRRHPGRQRPDAILSALAPVVVPHVAQNESGLAGLYLPLDRDLLPIRSSFEGLYAAPQSDAGGLARGLGENQKSSA